MRISVVVSLQALKNNDTHSKYITSQPLGSRGLVKQKHVFQFDVMLCTGILYVTISVSSGMVPFHNLTKLLVKKWTTTSASIMSLKPFDIN